MKNLTGDVEQDLEPDLKTMEDFLTRITAPWDRDAGWGLNIRAIVSGGGAENIVVAYDSGRGWLDEALQWAYERNDEGLNVYACVNPLKAGWTRPASAEGVETAFYHYVDGDSPEQVRSIRGFTSVTPAFVVRTGTIPHERLHAYYRSADVGGSIRAWKKRQQRLAQGLATDTAVQDAPRVMRIAGSVAWPDQKKLAKGYVAEVAALVPADWCTAAPPEGGYTWEQLSAGLPKLSEQATRGARSKGQRKPGLDVAGAIEAMKAGNEWHNHMVRVVGHLVAKGLDDEGIQALLAATTLEGYTIGQTRREVQSAIDGARRKGYDRESAQERVQEALGTDGLPEDWPARLAAQRRAEGRAEGVLGDLLAPYSAAVAEKLISVYGEDDLAMTDPSEIGMLADKYEVAMAADLFQPVPASPLPGRSLLPPEIAEVAYGYQDDIGADAGVIALGYLTALSGLHAGNTRLYLKSGKRSGHDIQGNMFGMAIAKPGANKTLAFKKGRDVLAAVQKYHNERAAEKRAARQVELEAGDATAAKIKAELDQIRAPRLFVGDTTPEGLRDALAHDGQEGRICALFVDELRGMLGAGYTGGRPTVQTYLEAFEGGPKPFQRVARGKVGGETIDVDNFAISMFGTIQAGVLQEAEEQHGLISAGLLQRFFPIIGTPRETADADGEDLHEIEVRIQRAAILVSCYPAQRYDLDEEALAAWRAAREQLTEEAKKLEQFAGEHQFAQTLQKGATLIGKFALTLHLTEFALRDDRGHRDVGRGCAGQNTVPPVEISADTMGRAIRLYREWFMPSLARTIRMTGDADAIVSAGRWLAKEAREGRYEFSRRDLSKNGSKGLRGKAHETFWLYRELEDRGWLIPIEADQDGFGRRWRVPRGLGERFSEAVEAYVEANRWMRELASGGD